MDVTVGAQCFDGFRCKSLNESIQEIETPIKNRHFDPRMKSLVGYTVPAMLVASLLKPIHLLAAPVDSVQTIGIPEGVKGTILHAFDPLIDLIQALAYPIAGVMIAGGCLFIMVGHRDKGMSMLQNAAIGYILVQLSPMLLKLLVGIGGSVA